MAIGEKFKKLMQSNIGVAVILMGSDSDDKPIEGRSSHIEKIAASLESYQIPYEARVCSAHKQPDTLKTILDEYNEVGGSVVYVAVAGGTDALSGTASFHAYGLVLSCPPDAPNPSCTTNPPGSPNAYIPNPSNVGKAVAQAFAGLNPKYKELLQQKNEAKIGKLETADNTIQSKYAARQDKGE